MDAEDLERRATAAAAVAGLGRVHDVERLPGGASSITFSAILDDDGGTRPIVLKAAPPGLPPVRNRDVLRQARVLAALASAPEVRVPAVLFDDAGDPPEVPPFFAMTFVTGECVEPILGDGPPPSPGDVDGRARSAARMLAALQRVRPEAIGLADEPEVTAEDELARWERAFATVEETLRGGATEACELLRRELPIPLPTVVVHGDYRLGNMLCQGVDVTAIIDWELWGRGDPRVDLAWLLLHRDPNDNPHANRPAPGMPTAADLLDEYRSEGGTPVDGLGWYESLARFKQAAAGALILKHRALALDSAECQANALIIRRQLQDAIDVLT